MKFPIYRQFDSRDCGPTCLCMISEHYKKSISIDDVREKSYIDKTGVNLLGLIEAAGCFGFEATAKRINIKDLKHTNKLPCILHWNDNHFVVLYKVKKNKYYIADPAYGKVIHSENDLLKSWANIEQKGVVLFIKTASSFVKEKKITFYSPRFLYKYVKNYKSLFIQLLVGLLIGSLLQLIFPFLTQLIVDYGIRLNNPGLIQLILIAQVMLVFSKSLVEILRRWILLHISTRVNLSLLSDFLVKLMKLSMRFFESKLTGDLIRRIEDHRRVETFLTQSLINLIFSSLTIIVFSVVLIIYDINIFFIFFIGSILYIIWIKLFLKKRAELDHKNFSQMSENQNSIIQLIYGMQEIKLTGSEQQKLIEWEEIQKNLFDIKKQSLSLSQWLQTGGTLINEIKNVFITILSAMAVINGEITLGGMLSIQYIIGQMSGPIDQFILFMQQAQDAHLSLERMSEIHNSEEEQNELSGIALIPNNADIEIQNISFSYTNINIEPAIKDLSLIIPHKKTTAIVGLSGSGKTTLIKLLLGFYSPQKGSIQIGDMAFERISLKEWRNHCGAVMQDGFIFNDSIIKNIAPGESEKEIDLEKINLALEMANLNEYIEALPNKIYTKIGSTGRGLSQGQKQRLLIARTIYKNPGYIFFDEATNALDAENESVIMKNLNMFFKNKTVIISAHRLSTVKNADQIIVLEKGSILEIGNHHELIKNRSTYYNLVKEQLTLDA